MPFDPLYMTDCVLKIDGTDFQAQVSSVRFDPTANRAVWKGLTPTSIHSRTGHATWIANVTLAQDYDEAASLANYLIANEGEQKPCTFEPKAGGASIAATLDITPGAIGGNVDQFAEASVAMGSSKPIITPAA